MLYNDFKELVMAAAKANRLEEYELYYQASEGISTEALQHDINAFSTSIQAGACFRCIHAGKIGYAATERFDADEAERIVEAAMQNAEATESAESAWIHETGDAYEEIVPVTTSEPSAAQLRQLVLATQEAAYRRDARIVDGTQTAAAFRRSTVAISNSKGLDLSHTADYSLLYCYPSVKENDELYNGFELKAGDFTELSADAVANAAVDEAVSCIGADTVPTGSYPIVFSGKMTATLLATFFSAFSAEAAQRGLSLFRGKEGEQVAAPSVSIVDDPFPQDSLLRIPFDSEGVATYRKKVVENGTLTTLLHNLTTAHKAGVSSTGNGCKENYASKVGISPYNFYLEAGGAGSKEALFENVRNGIYVTELNGLHAGADPSSGDFSLASAGFLITDGKLGKPVKNFTVSGNFYELLKQVALIGDDVEFMPIDGSSRYGAPAIVVNDVSVAGK
ncbi:MAG: metallopeptidase TldD-related protein [Lachnospiraceae bacterium]|nr:metallopeptidase TldD-related protein [Lachnospiraceae bacterium]